MPRVTSILSLVVALLTGALPLTVCLHGELHRGQVHLLGAHPVHDGGRGDCHHHASGSESSSSDPARDGDEPDEHAGCVDSPFDVGAPGSVTTLAAAVTAQAVAPAERGSACAVVVLPVADTAVPRVSEGLPLLR